MLLRITNKCTMGCSHCFIDKSGPEGGHMTWEVFGQSLQLGKILGSSIVLISGGEPTEHPEFERFVRRSHEVFRMTVVASNGLFAIDDEKYETVRRLIWDGAGRIIVQVTNDPRYYPLNLDLVRHRFDGYGFSYEDHIQQLAPCARVTRNGLVPTRRSPLCFNLRANARRMPLTQAITRLDALGRACSPSIDPDGTVRAGEMDTCHALGTVRHSITDISREVATMTCRKCGLWRGLTPQELEMIGESEEA